MSLLQLTLYADVQSSRITQQSTQLLLHVPFVKHSSCQKLFSVYGPSIWNTLPHIMQCSNIVLFKQLCKQFL